MREKEKRISWVQPMELRPDTMLREGTCVLRQLVGGGWELGEGTPIVVAVTAGRPQIPKEAPKAPKAKLQQ